MVVTILHPFRPHLGHRPYPDLATSAARKDPMSVTLVTGGVRSGKSRHAETLLAGQERVTYLATNRPVDGQDPEWADRVGRHRARRPPTWTTVETLDVVRVLAQGNGPVLLECLGTWLTGLVDEASAWDDLHRARATGQLNRDALVAVLGTTSRDVVVVTNEVGWSLVPTTASGRFFQDELGTLNAAVAGVAHRVHLVVAGRVLDLGSSASPP